MAYGTKYRFRFDNIHGVGYEVLLMERNYDGTVTDRPLGASPVIRMQDSGPFRSTCCELTLECQADVQGVGEFAFLYTSDPQKYKVVVNVGQVMIWQGFVATEIYSEPDIAPPYDVRVTATDGLGVLKEYDFEPAGERTIREHLSAFLGNTGLAASILAITSLREHGKTTVDFLDGVLIDLDYHEGDNCYDVLLDLLKTLRLTITQWGGNWLVVRETDVAVNGSGRVPGYCSPIDPEVDTYSLNIDDLTATVGQMGVAQMWPVGYLTRRVSPAKRKVKVRAPWHWKSGFPSVSDDGWNVSGYPGYEQNAYFVAAGGYYNLGSYSTAVMDAMYGKLWSQKLIRRFVDDLKVTVRVSKNSQLSSIYAQGTSALYIYADCTYGSTSSNTIHYSNTDGWEASAGDRGTSVEITTTNPGHDIASTQEVSVVIPAPLKDDLSAITIRIDGRLVEVYDIRVEPSTIEGYEDTVIIDNGARGDAELLEIAGGRMMTSNFINTAFYRGVFLWMGDHHVLTSYDDADNSELDYLSLTALNYAKVHAAPRVEISGKIDFPLGRFEPPLLVSSHGSWALVERYDWNLKDAEIDFRAVTLPAVTLDVESETITSLGD